MKTEAEIKNQIMSVADKIGAKVVALNGSRVYQTKNTDDFQDFDIVYFVSDDKMQTLIDNRQWLDDFGEVLVMQTPMDLNPKPIDNTKRFNFLMLFKDGWRLDLGLVPLSEIATWAKKDPVAKILSDPNQLLKDLPLEQTNQRYRRKKPSQGAFTRHANQFWWSVPYVIKGILRKQFMYAADNYYENVFGEYLVMMEWMVSGRNNFEAVFGQNLKFLFDYLDADEKIRLESYADFSSFTMMKDNLLNMMMSFNEIAKKFASDYGFDYNADEALNVIEYAHQKLA